MKTNAHGIRHMGGQYDPKIDHLPQDPLERLFQGLIASDFLRAVCSDRFRPFWPDGA